MNKCIRCGRRLKDPLSIKLGIGPECRTKKTTAHAQRVLIKENRRNNLEKWLPIDVGHDPKTKMPIRFTPDGQGNYISPEGRQIAFEQFKAYLERFGWI